MPERTTRTVPVEGVDVDAVVEYVGRWHETHRTNSQYAGIRVVAPPAVPRHCTVAIDFTSTEVSEALESAIAELLGELTRLADIAPGVTEYRRRYTSREDQS